MSQTKPKPGTSSAEIVARSCLDAVLFLRRSSELRKSWLSDQISRLSRVRSFFDWSRPESMGISDDAWRRLSELQIEPVRVFCHPVLLREQPRLVTYYRQLAQISRHDLAIVAGTPGTLETAEALAIEPEWCGRVAVTLNTVISSMLTALGDATAADVRVVLLAAASTRASRNSDALAATQIVRTILVERLKHRLEQVGWTDSTASDYTPDLHTELIDRVADLRVLRLKNGYNIRFASEPDVSLRDPKDLPLLAIEVKAGADPAGALERLGAAMKSFENDRNLNPRLKTVYVVRALTPELQKRISQTKPFDYTFSLSELLVSDKTQNTFANLFLRAMLGK